MRWRYRIGHGRCDNGNREPRPSRVGSTYGVGSICRCGRPRLVVCFGRAENQNSLCTYPARLSGYAGLDTGKRLAYTELSAIKLDQLPFFLLACRFFRYPPPPQSWLPIIDEMITPVKGWEWARKRMGGVNLVKRAARLSVAWPSLMSGEE